MKSKHSLNFELPKPSHPALYFPIAPFNTLYLFFFFLLILLCLVYCIPTRSSLMATGILSVLCIPAVSPVPGTVLGTWCVLSPHFRNERSWGWGRAQIELQENGTSWKKRNKKVDLHSECGHGARGPFLSPPLPEELVLKNTVSGQTWVLIPAQLHLSPNLMFLICKIEVRGWAFRERA